MTSYFQVAQHVWVLQLVITMYRLHANSMHTVTVLVEGVFNQNSDSIRAVSWRSDVTPLRTHLSGAVPDKSQIVVLIKPFKHLIDVMYIARNLKSNFFEVKNNFQISTYITSQLHPQRPSSNHAPFTMHVYWVPDIRSCTNDIQKEHSGYLQNRKKSPFRYLTIIQMLIVSFNFLFQISKDGVFWLVINTTCIIAVYTLIHFLNVKFTRQHTHCIDYFYSAGFEHYVNLLLNFYLWIPIFNSIGYPYNVVLCKKNNEKIEIIWNCTAVGGRSISELTCYLPGSWNDALGLTNKHI